MVLYIGKNKITPSAYCVRPVGTIEIKEDGFYDVENFINANVEVGGGVVEKSNIYSLSMVEELEEELLFGSIYKSASIETEILGDDSTITPLRDEWTYKEGSISEIYKNILTNDHSYVEEKFKEILGENNE